MSSGQDDYEFDETGALGSDFMQIEEAIFRARNYVVPSEDLRPRTLEIARESSMARRSFRRLGLLAIACLVAWIICLPTSQALNVLRHHIVATSTEEMQHFALELSAQSRYGGDWGLVDAFLQLRNVHKESAPAAQANRTRN